MNWTREDILESIGLQTIPNRAANVVPAVGLFGVGILVGAGLGMLFAPKPGRELRADLARNAEDLKNRLPEQMQNLKNKLPEQVQNLLPQGNGDEAAQRTAQAQRTQQGQQRDGAPKIPPQH
jgi:gas vesicle protein